MHNWFECKVKLEKTVDDGKIIKVGESYLVDALSFTEAEERMVQEMKPFISGDFQIATVKRVKISELFFNDNGDKWYRCKVNFVTFDEEKGIEKRTPVVMMVQASDFRGALDGLTEGMKGTMADWEVAVITETTIMDVFRFDSEFKSTQKES
ncbi:MAG: DUF4494 domain-containing protein [Paludibacter sp.]|jgi:hypothetical protein|nr:DUF4494 domain-containing protein [Paludibacter sp.]